MISGRSLPQNVTHTIICLYLCRWQSPSDGYQHSLPPGADAGYSDSGGEGERVRRNGTMYGVSSSPQDPGDTLHPGQSGCEFLVLFSDFLSFTVCTNTISVNNIGKCFVQRKLTHFNQMLSVIKAKSLHHQILKQKNSAKVLMWEYRCLKTQTFFFWKLEPFLLSS